MTGRGDQAVLARLRAAVDVQLLVRDPLAGSFQFRHALSRDAVLANLTATETSRFAQRGLEALEVADPELRGEWCELAAELAERAGRPNRAAELLVVSARIALALGAVATAEIVLHRARALAPRTGTLALEVDEASAHAAVLSGHIDRAVELAEGILANFDSDAGSRHRSAHLHLLPARAAITGGRWDVARPQVAHALAAATYDLAVVPAAEAQGAQIAIADGRLDEAIRLGRSALSVAETAGVPQVACEALEVLGRMERPGRRG